MDVEHNYNNKMPKIIPCDKKKNILYIFYISFAMLINLMFNVTNELIK